MPVGTAVAVGVMVAVIVAVGLVVSVDVAVPVAVAVAVAVALGVADGITVGISVAVGVRVGGRASCGIANSCPTSIRSGSLSPFAAMSFATVVSYRSAIVLRLSPSRTTCTGSLVVGVGSW